MSNLCSIGLPAGINGDCLKFPAPIKNILFADKSISFSSASDFINRNTWETKIQQDLTVFVPAELSSYEDTTDDPTINTNTFGKKYVVREGVPSMAAYFESNVCDYNELRAKFKGGTYQIFFILEDNTLMGRMADLGVVKGFTAAVHAIGGALPKLDAVENSFPVYINFKSTEEFEKRTVKDPVAWNPNIDLPAAMPSGLSMIQTVAYTAGDATVKVYERCGDAYASLSQTSEFEILGSNDLDTPAVTAIDDTDAASGIYVLTLQKGGTPANLDAGDYIRLRVKVTSGSDVTYLSNDIIITA